MKVKVSFGQDIRVWRRQEDVFDALKRFVESSFESLDDDFLLTYADDEGDRITIASQEDLDEALELYEELNKKSIRIFVAFSKVAQRVDEPGAFHPHKVEANINPNAPREEIVSEPGVGLDEEKELEEERVDPLEMMGMPKLSSSVRSDQIEGSPAKQSIMYWMRSLLPLLGEHGVVEELKASLPELFLSLDQGDDLGTAIQTTVARCHLLQEQAIVQEFMNHIQHKVAPLSDEIVPHMLRLGPSGLSDILDKMSNVAKQWRSGVSNLTFDCAPIFMKLWPALLARLESQNAMPCEIPLGQINMGPPPEPSIQSSTSTPQDKYLEETAKLGTTPFSDPVEYPEAAERFQNEDKPRFRLVEDENEPPLRRSWRGNNRGRGMWTRGSGQRRSAHRNERRGPYFDPESDPWYHHQRPPPPHHHPPHHPGYQHRSQTRYDHRYMRSQDPYHNTRGHPHHVYSFEDKDFRSTPWEPVPPKRSKTPNLTESASRRRFDFPSQPRLSDNRLEQPPKNEVRISTTPLKAEFVDHVNIPLRSKYLPGQKLLKKWCVRNVGADDWSKDISLKFTKGDECLPTKKVFDVPTCSSGQLCELSAMIETPPKPGRYTAYFRLNRGDTFFGPRIWVDVHVVSTESELTEEDEQTQKRLERIENRASQQRSSQTRRSATKSSIRATQRRSSQKKKQSNSHISNMEDDFRGHSGIGLVEIPVFEPREPRRSTDRRSGRDSLQRGTLPPPLRNSTLNRDAEEFQPMQKRKPGLFDEQVKELYNMGFQGQDDVIRCLLDQHNGDVVKVIDVLVSQNSV